MLDWTKYPTYSPYRTLRLADPYQVGFDVYALQTALKELGFDPGVIDGVLGPKTSSAIKTAQTQLDLTVDGLAGGKTQEALARKIADFATTKYSIARGALRGQLEHESSFRLGNYSAMRDNGSYDAGVAQRNTEHTPAQEGFTVPSSIDVLGDVVRTHYNLFAGVFPAYRRWSLAQGAWNAPAYACWIANEEGAHVPVAMTKRPGPTARATLEEYISDVSIYLQP